MIMFRKCCTYPFELVSDGIRIPCHIEIVTAIQAPNVDPCVNPSDIMSAQLSDGTRWIISQRVFEVLDGKPFDAQPLSEDGPVLTTPEDIAVWVYQMVNSLSMVERHDTRGKLTIESVRVVYADQAWVEYAPTGDTR